MSLAVRYNGKPLAVYIDYKDGMYVIYDKENKTYGARYSSFEKAKKHAMEWNRIYKRAF